MAEWKKVIVSGSDAHLNTVTASFKGDGSGITGVQASGLNIEGFTDGTGVTVASTDKLLLSDGGTEKYINVSQLPFTTDTNTFRGVGVDSNGDGDADSSLAANESLVLKKGSNISLSESGGVVTIASTDTNTQLSTSDVRGKISGTGLIGYNSGTGVISTTANNYSMGIKINDGDASSVASGAAINLKAGTNVSLTQDGTTVSIVSTDTNTQLSTSDVRGKISGTGLISYNSSTGVISTTANNYVLPEATATAKGGIELFSNTDQTVAANTVSATSGRTYGIQLNSDGQAVVNVPWSDTNTNTQRSDASVYALFSGGDNVEISDEGVITSTDTNTQLSTSDVRGKISGTGLISYNSSTGVISTTANNYSLTAADVKSVLGGGMPSNALTIGDSGDTITIAGNLDVNGTTTTIDTANLAVKDKFIELNSGATTEGDGGIVINGATNKSFGWDDSSDRWAFDFAGATAGQTTIGADAFAAAIVVGGGTGTEEQDSNYAKLGNIFVNKDELDIYIYV